MKETGIIRRIDELGRIVIPKEIRKRLSIDNGDMVDIYVEDKQIVLTKFHPLTMLSDNIKGFMNALKEVYPYSFIVLDKEKVITSSIDGMKGRLISKEFYEKAHEVIGRECPLSTLKLDFTSPTNFDLYILPIRNGYDFFGYVIVIDNMITTKHKEFTSILANYISSLV